VVGLCSINFTIIKSKEEILVVPHPFTRKLIKNCFIFFGISFASTIVLGMFWMIAPAIWIGYKLSLRKKKQRQATEVIKKETNEEITMMVDGYSMANGEYGKLGITQNFLFFVPENGQGVVIDIHNITAWGYKGEGTGTYTAVHSSVGSTVSEAKIRVFYCEVNGILHKWVAHKEDKFMDIINKIKGVEEKKGLTGFARY
jgi:hypothetical protein